MKKNVLVKLWECKLASCSSSNHDHHRQCYLAVQCRINAKSKATSRYSESHSQIKYQEKKQWDDYEVSQKVLSSSSQLSTSTIFFANSSWVWKHVKSLWASLWLQLYPFIFMSTFICLSSALFHWVLQNIIGVSFLDLFSLITFILHQPLVSFVFLFFLQKSYIRNIPLTIMSSNLS